VSTKIIDSLGLGSITAVFSSGYLYNSYLHFMKTHLNCKPMIQHKVKNIDRIFCIKLKLQEEDANPTDAFLLSSQDGDTSVVTIESDAFVDKTEDLGFIKDEFTVLSYIIEEKSVLQVTTKRIMLFKQDGKTEITKIDGFNDENSLKQAWLYSKHNLMFCLSKNEKIKIYNVKHDSVSVDEQMTKFFETHSEIVQKSEPVISCSIVDQKHENGKDYSTIYFICSSNGLFEIFNSEKRIFKCKENIKCMPSMITDVDESDIIGTRCFTDLTVPLNVDADQNILKNIMHSIKEIVYHTFDNKTVYIFAILQSGNIQVFKQINRYDGGTKIRFKKVLIPDLIGKKVNIDLQEYSVKDKDLLSLKRQRSNTISYLDGTKEYQRITCTQIRVMENNMIYIKDLGVVIHEMKGNIFSYSLTNNRN